MHISRLRVRNYPRLIQSVEVSREYSRRMKGILVVLGVVCCVLPSLQKSIVLVGGGDMQAEHFQAIIDLAGGDGVARIGCVTAASHPLDAPTNGEWYVTQFQLRGALEAYWIPVFVTNETANSDPEVVANVQRMTGIMFGGGDQKRIIDTMYNLPGRTESPVLAAIRDIFNSGGPVGGTSAGLAAMGVSPMIMGGTSYHALKFGAYIFGQEQDPDDLVYDPDGGIGMLEGFILDSHFSERGREGRLIRLVSDTSTLSNGVLRGIGVDEDTALVLLNVNTASMTGELVGPHGALIVDLRESTLPTGGIWWDIQNIYAHYLTNGDIINFADMSITFGSWKSNLLNDEKYVLPLETENIFKGANVGNDPEFVRVSTSPYDSQGKKTVGRTLELTPTFQINFYQNISDSFGYGGYRPDNEAWQISYIKCRLDIADVPNKNDENTIK